MIALVYFAQAETGPVKIGFSTDVPRRLGNVAGRVRRVADGGLR